MAKKKSQSHKLAELAGWYGAAATLSAYFLVSFALISPRDLPYQLLNLTGSIGLGIVCYTKRTYQPLFVNIVWGTVAILAIGLILTHMTR